MSTGSGQETQQIRQNRLTHISDAHVLIILGNTMGKIPENRKFRGLFVGRYFMTRSY